MSAINSSKTYSQASNIAVTTIKPRKRVSLADITTLWQYRDLCWTLSIRDIQIRYKQTLLGAAWAVIQPLASSGIATIIFGQILGLASGTLTEYFLEVFPAMILWTLFASIVTQSSNSLLSNAEMLRKVYFPRLIIPISSAGAPLLDFAVSTITLLAVLLLLAPSAISALAIFPFAIASTLTAALGIGFALSAFTAIYRDFRLILTFITQLLFFLTPIMYPLHDRIPENWLPLFTINPMFGPIAAIKNSLASQPIHWNAFAISFSVGVACLVIGFAIFNKIERQFADVI